MAASLARVRALLGAAVVGVDPGIDTANRLCTACVDLLDVDGAAISLVADGRTQGTFGASSDLSRRLDEYQFTYGEGPCLDASRDRRAVLVPDLEAAGASRWPGFTDAVLADGVRAVFALPIMVTTVCVGALDLFRAAPGALSDTHLAGGVLAAELAALPLLDLAGDVRGRDTATAGADEDGWTRLDELDRLEVHQATGMLIAGLDIGPAEALLRLRAHAVATGRTASEVAWAIVERRLVLDRDPPAGTADPTEGTTS